MYSCVAPGPPCSSSTFIVGLLPTRLVQTLNVPFGVAIGIIFTPPVNTSSRPAEARYPFAALRALAPGAGEHALTATAQTIQGISRLIVFSRTGRRSSTL